MTYPSLAYTLSGHPMPRMLYTLTAPVSQACALVLVPTAPFLMHVCAEYIALGRCAKDVIYFRQFASQLGPPHLLFSDAHDLLPDVATKHHGPASFLYFRAKLMRAKLQLIT